PPAEDEVRGGASPESETPRRFRLNKPPEEQGGRRRGDGEPSRRVAVVQPAQLQPACPGRPHRSALECHAGHLHCNSQDRSASQSRTQEHPAEALLSEIRGEAEAKESSSRQSHSGEQQQTAEGGHRRCWKPVKRKKLNQPQLVLCPPPRLSMSCDLYSAWQLKPACVHLIPDVRSKGLKKLITCMMNV
ncbi:unnamed protein product, partial [Urochloa humidicola]